MRWDVDDRRASVWTRLYIRGMWAARDKDAFEGARHTMRTALRKQDQGSRPPTRPTRWRCRTSATVIAGLRVWVVRPRRARPLARVIYVHGGGYVHPLSADYWRLVRATVRGGAEVWVPDYPLAPDATVDEVLPGLVQLVREAARARPALPVVSMGDSAGGALVLEMAAALRGQQDQVTGVVALCPWLDATLAQDEVRELEATDPMLAESGLRAAGRVWAGPRRGPDDPVVSPLHQDLRGLPPIDVFIGRRDILRPAVDDFAERARREGTALHVHESRAMFHVWMTRVIPEARATRRELACLLRRRTAAWSATRGA